MDLLWSFDDEDQLHKDERESLNKLRLAYDEIPPKDRKDLNYDELIASCDLHMPWLVSLITQRLIERGTVASVIRRSVALPDLMMQAIKTAMGKGKLAQDERASHFQATGLLPTTKTQTITNVSVSATANAESKSLSVGMPSFEANILALEETMKLRQLGPTTAVEVKSEEEEETEPELEPVIVN